MRRSICLCLSLVLALACGASAQVGPDVIVGDITGVTNYAHNTGTGIDACSVGTTSCNIGDMPLSWIAGTNAHPVIGQHLYRVYAGRCEMIGQSWLKHGFAALAGSECTPCNGSGGSDLDPGCSDPYGSGLNGSQSGLGPKWEVNAWNGVFPYPFTDGNQGSTGDSQYKRLQFNVADVNPANFPGARFFVEAHYVTQDDAAWGNQHNNASWREVVFSPNGSGYDMSYASGSMTMRTEPAIKAWETVNPGATVKTVDVPGEGRFWVGLNTIPVGGSNVLYEYTIHNLNSDRSARGFTVQFPAGATVSGAGFHDVDYHSGEPWSGTDWPSSFANDALTWETDHFNTDPNANAIRWGTAYSFRCISDMAPTGHTLELFKPGAPTFIPFSFAPPVPGNGQAPQPGVAVLDVNNSLDVNGLPVSSGFNGPYFTTAGFPGTIHLHFEGQAGQAIVLFEGPLNVGVQSFPGLGQLDVGNLGGMGQLMDVAIVASRLSAGFINQLFVLRADGTQDLTFSTSVHVSGMIFGFQTFTFNTAPNPPGGLSNVVELTVM